MLENIKNFINKNLKWIILLLCVIAFLFIMKDVFSKEIIGYDRDVYEIIARFISNKNTIIIKFITNFGSSLVLVLITLLILFLIKERHYGVLIGINLGTVALFNNVLKLLIRRKRPTIFPIIEEIGYSFPSGHSMVSMAFYGFIIYLIYKKVRNKKTKCFLISLICVLIILIGISRIYLGVHYPSDVMAGFLIGISYLILYISIVNKYLNKIKEFNS